MVNIFEIILKIDVALPKKSAILISVDCILKLIIDTFKKGDLRCMKCNTKDERLSESGKAQGKIIRPQRYTCLTDGTPTHF